MARTIALDSVSRCITIRHMASRDDRRGDEKRYEDWERDRHSRREAHERRRRGSREARDERKERVLHTRISETLAEDIRRVADDLRVPVSNLVRNVLEDVFHVVESVADNVGDVVDDVLAEVDRAGKGLRRRTNRYAPEEYEEEPEEPGPEPGRELPGFPEVIGWQPMVLNAEQRCAGCERAIRRGARGFVGLQAGGPSTTYLCRACASEVV
jgi:hypothetical protein